MEAYIYEQGNGFPVAGDYCVGGGELYEVVEILGRIETGDTRGNRVLAEVEPAEWSDCAEEDEHTALVVPS